MYENSKHYKKILMFKNIHFSIGLDVTFYLYI